MDIYCLEEFKSEFDKLNSRKSYRDLQFEIIDYFFDKTPADVRSGRYLNQGSEIPYIKKRLKGAGGYRVYYLLVDANNNVYLMFVHAKTGSMGASNVTDATKALLYKKVLTAIKNNDLYKLEVDKKKITFTWNKKKS